MKELLLFGRSPFIKTLNLKKIDYDRFDVCCINYPIPGIKVHYVVSADPWTKPILAPKTEWISTNTGWELVKTDEIVQEKGRLSWRIYSSSLAVNFAILRGYKTIYIAGVDLIEDDKPFVHYDGVVNTKKASISGCIQEKEYIKKLAETYGVKLYTLNREAQWIEYYDKRIF